MSKKITIADLNHAKTTGSRFAAVSCYDYTTASLVAKTSVEMILVGDSAAQVMLGYDSTLPATMDFMVAITSAVRRGAPDAYLVADMPFLSYQLGPTEAIRNAGRFVVESGAEMVKIEAWRPQLDTVKAISDAGIAVMAHLGISPQAVGKFGKEALKAQGNTAESAMQIIALAGQMVEAGAAMLLLEGVAREVAKIITERSDVPVVSCGAGPDCDGQILIIPDILGLSEGKLPKFSKSYGSLAGDIVEAVESYADEVKTGKFPDDQHCYHIRQSQRQQFEDMLKDGRFQL